MDDTASTKKRGRVAYDADSESRAVQVREFVKSLKFSVPLWRLREENRERRVCPTCGKRRMYYCYDCLTVVSPLTHPPPLVLPLQVYVVYHPGELRGKSTSLAASTISPDIHIVEYPNLPAEMLPRDDGDDGAAPALGPENTLVLYPSAHSCELSEIRDLERYRNVVFVDSTWQQSKAIARDERIGRFKHVRIKTETSLFWRFQNNDPSYLATVEAIYYFLRAYIVERSRKAESLATDSRENGPKAPDSTSSEVSIGRWYHGEMDDLLFYYINQYIAVQQEYSQKSKRYTTRHFDGYVIEGAAWDDLVRPPS